MHVQSLVLYSCHPGGTTLKREGAISLSGNPWEGNPNLSPIRKGAVPVSNQNTAGHSLQSVDLWSQSPICWPVQITVNWPIERLSSRDGTYLSVMQRSQLFSHLKLIQYLNHKLWYFPIPFTFQYPCPSTKYIYNFTTNSITFHRIVRILSFDED